MYSLITACALFSSRHHASGFQNAGEDATNENSGPLPSNALFHAHDRRRMWLGSLTTSARRRRPFQKTPRVPNRPDEERGRNSHRRVPLHSALPHAKHLGVLRPLARPS